MSKHWLRLALAFVLSAFALAWAAPPAQDEIAVQTFFKKRAYGGVVMSPSHRYVAALAPINGRQNVVIVDLKDRSASVLTSYDSRDVDSVFWANDDRIVYTTGDQQGLEFRGDGGLFAVDRNAKNHRVLVEPIMSRGAVFVLRLTTVLSRTADNADEILVSANDRVAGSQDIYRMNVVTGRKTLVSVVTPGHVLKWVLNKSGEPVAALSADMEKKQWWFSYRSADGSQWLKGAQWNEALKDVVVPVALDPVDEKSVYVGSNTGRDTMALFKFNMATGKLGNVLFADDRYDLFSFYLLGAPLGEGGRLMFDGSDESPGKLIGIRYQADKLTTVWFDEKSARAQATVDSALPGSINTFDVTQARTLVSSRSDTKPGEYFIFDQVSKTLEETGMKIRPWIDSRKMAPMQYVTWTARDGMKIGGYLTLPLNYKPGSPVPLILHPHGGPWAKDNWEFNAEVQFMANRGFAVLQPNFRGSTGYGAQHLRASYKHWGDTMIDDMLDGVDWTIKQGYVDPKRVGVYGASYGGYATLMALVKKPELFKWGINYVGVTDMTLHQNTQPAQRWGDFGNLAATINGDQNADKELFFAQSPTRQIDKIVAPVFHAYGGEDRNVDYANGRAIRDAFDAAKKPYEWMLALDEAHGYRVDKNVFEFYERFDRFIKKYTPVQ